MGVEMYKVLWHICGSYMAWNFWTSLTFRAHTCYFIACPPKPLCRVDSWFLTTYAIINVSARFTDAQAKLSL